MRSLQVSSADQLVLPHNAGRIRSVCYYVINLFENEIQIGNYVRFISESNKVKFLRIYHAIIF
jgi:hypothetical protein